MVELHTRTRRGTQVSVSWWAGGKVSEWATGQGRLSSIPKVSVPISDFTQMMGQI